MLPFPISCPPAYSWVQSSLNTETQIQYFPFYTVPIQIIIPSTFQQSSPTIETQQLEKKIEYFPKSKSILQEKQVTHKRSQNKYRNILTNITNVILNFIICPKKASQLLLRIDPSLTQSDQISFYQYVKDLKKYFCSYYNPIKLKALFKGSTLPKIAAKIILQERIPECLMTSKKISQQLRQDHFCARRIILSILKYGNAPNQNIYSISF